MSRKVARALRIARRVKRAEGGEVSFEDRWGGEPYRETADDVAARARNLLHSQPQRTALPEPPAEVAYDPMTGARIGADLDRTEPEAAPNRYARATIQAVANMPKAMLWDAPRDLVDAARESPFVPGQPPSDDLVQQSFMTAIGLAGTAAPMAQRGAAGIFGGRLAQTADHAKLARAEEMHAAGADPRVIWNETGWFQGTDGQWRFEIPDAESGFFRKRTPTTIDNYDIVNPRTVKTGEAYNHPDLYAAYPDLRDVDLQFAPLRDINGYYRRPGTETPGDLIPPPEEQIGLNTPHDRYGDNMKRVRSTMLHELQHAVQQREGFAPGSSPGAMSTLVQVGEDARLLAQLGSGFEFKKATGRDPHPAARTLVAQMTPEELAQIERDPYNAYRRVAGEVEARNVQTRRDFGDTALTKPPWATEDIPREKQLIGTPNDPAAPALDAVPGQREVSIDDLSPEVHSDIANTLMERVPELGEYARGRPEDIESLIKGAHPTISVPRRMVDPRSIDLSNRQVSQRAVDKYAKLTTEPPPILMEGGKLIEGGHRVAAAQKTGRHLPAIDVSDLLKGDWKGWLEGGELHPKGLSDVAAAKATAERPTAAADPVAVGSGGGRPGGNASLPEAQAAAARWAGERKPLEGLPGPLKIGDEHFVPGPIGKIHDVAEDYMRTHHPDRPYTPPTKYHPLDPEHSKAIAQAYEEMQHTPNDPATKASYDALIKETQDQYNAIKKTGLKIEPILPGMEDPYAANPRLAAKDVAENNHLWYFPTEQGFGTVNKISDNPMLRKTGERIGDHELLANDMFRIVHDYFGHLKEGHGFRAAGEDNAWRTHSAMYSDIARPAMTTETRGQNSWVNYGPHGEKNRKANAAETTYADQKVGLLPEWVMRDRGSPAPMMVYHGTPHSFNRFDISKIGAGEGNQAYGHGLYFAGHEPVSEWYRHQLATRQDPLLENYRLQDVGHVIGSHLSDFGGDAAKLAAKYADERNKLIAGGDTSKATTNMIDEYARRIEYLNDPQRSTGHMYQVGMNVNPDHLLDYDAMFANQTPHVQGRTGPVMEQSIKEQIEAIDRLLEKGGTGTPGTRSFRPYTSFKRQDLEGRRLLLDQAGPNAFKGSEIYQRTGLPAKDPSEASVKASQRLRDMGIPGLRYKDAGSRAPGQQGSHNFVMFGDDMLNILRKYGVVGIPAAGVLGADGEERRARGGKVDAAVRLSRAAKRAGGGSVFDWSGVGEAMPEHIGRDKIVDPLVTVPQSLVTLPQRALESSRNMVETGEYDPAPILEAATLPMGTGAMAGVRALPREAIMGSGPVRRIADDTGAAMTVARKVRAAKSLPPEVIGDRSKFIDPDTGMAIPGPAYTKEAQAISRDIAQMPKGEGPLDLSLQGKVPGVDQVPLERYVPPRGVSGRMQDALTNPSVRSGLEESMQAGAGVRDWYHTEPVRQAFVESLGPERGAAAFKEYMDLVAATSPRSDVPTNIRNASYYYGGGDPLMTNPYPYGHVAQKLHKQNVGTVASEGGWDVMQNPKPASFAANLRGNLEPVTVDTHAFRNIGMRTGDPRFLETSLSNVYRQGHSGAEDTLAGRYGELKETPKGTIVTYRPQQLHKEGRLTMEDAKEVPAFWAAKPKDNEYAAAENLFREVGDRVGMRPADAQAAAWAGAGDLTGLGTVGTHTFPELMNERIMFTAKMRGEDPQKVLRDFITRKKPLLSIGAAGAAAPVVGEVMNEKRANGGAVSNALEIARSLKRARGGKVHVGAIRGDTDGRADEVPMEVPDGAYVLTADHVSSMGEGNTLSGFKKLDQMFPKSAAAHAVRKTVKRAAGGAVPIYAADGEYVICPEDITDRWGDLEAGHRYLDAWQTSSRKEHVNTLRNLAPPAQD